MSYLPRLNSTIGDLGGYPKRKTGGGAAPQTPAGTVSKFFKGEVSGSFRELNGYDNYDFAPITSPKTIKTQFLNTQTNYLNFLGFGEALGEDKDQLLFQAQYNTTYGASTIRSSTMCYLNTKDGQETYSLIGTNNSAQGVTYSRVVLSPSGNLSLHSWNDTTTYSSYKDFNPADGSYSQTQTFSNISSPGRNYFTSNQELMTPFGEARADFAYPFKDDEYFLTIHGDSTWDMGLCFVLRDINTGRVVRSAGTSSSHYHWKNHSSAGGQTVGNNVRGVKISHLDFEGDYPALSEAWSSDNFDRYSYLTLFENGLWQQPTKRLFNQEIPAYSSGLVIHRYSSSCKSFGTQLVSWNGLHTASTGNDSEELSFRITDLLTGDYKQFAVRAIATAATIKNPSFNGMFKKSNGNFVTLLGYFHQAINDYGMVVLEFNGNGIVSQKTFRHTNTSQDVLQVPNYFKTSTVQTVNGDFIIYTRPINYQGTFTFVDEDFSFPETGVSGTYFGYSNVIYEPSVSLLEGFQLSDGNYLSWVDIEPRNSYVFNSYSYPSDFNAQPQTGGVPSVGGGAFSDMTSTFPPTTASYFAVDTY